MGVLGGGGPQAAFGMKLWTEKVGLVSGIGRDLPAKALAWLEASGIDRAGLRYADQWPTLRAWQILETDGRRTQVWRIPGPAIGAQLRRSLEELPSSYRGARGFHLGIHPEAPDLAFIQALRNLGAVVSLEPFRPAAHPLDPDEVRELASAGQIFSPNLEEAESLVGPGQPLELIHRLAEAGAQIVALRQGAAGSTVHHASSGQIWHIPALATRVVDPTGAGNAFCGGFLVGWVQRGEVRLAGLYGAVAASFLVNQVGLPEARQDRAEAATQRLEQLESQVVQVA
jgi:sugar/nucleoside kinase (ribokinase family)